MRYRTESERHSIHEQMGLPAEEREFYRPKQGTIKKKTKEKRNYFYIKQQGQEACYKLPSSDKRIDKCIKRFFISLI